MNEEPKPEHDPAVPPPAAPAPWAPAPPPPVSSASAPAHCALHVERLAAASCARCGTFLCAACAIRPEWADATYCKDCVGRLDASGGGGIVPWEDHNLPFLKRYGRTLAGVVGSPARFFSRMAPHGYGPAIGFQYCVMPFIVLMNILLTYFRLKTMFGNILSSAQLSAIMTRSIIGLVVVVALIPILHFIAAGWMHVHFLLFGARRGFAATYRLTSYLYALLFVFALLQVLTFATQLDLSPQDIQNLMRGKTSGFAVATAILTGVIGIVYVTIAGAKAQRIHPLASFGAILLVTLESMALWIYVLVPLMERAAATARF